MTNINVLVQQYRRLLVQAPKLREQPSLTSPRALSRQASRLAHSSPYLGLLIRLTLRHVRRKSTSAPVLMYFSIPWKVTQPFRKLSHLPADDALLGTRVSVSDAELGRYTERMPRPANPINRPAYQGSNPVADIFSLWALKQTVKYLPRIAKNRDDTEARRQMLSVICESTQLIYTSHVHQVAMLTL